MDHGVYDIDFTREGRRRVYLFSYLLGYSRRQYLRFVESMDLPTTLREHVHAFHHLGGVARVCLYDNFKAVVFRHDADGALYNPKFLAFATHYGFRPQACRVRRPQTKGKVERKFFYVETNLLNGRTFDTLEHLNEVTAWWLANVADARVLRDFKESPLRASSARTAALVAAAGGRLRHRLGRLSPRQRRRLHHPSAQLLLGAVVATSARCCRCASPTARSSSTRSAWRRSPGIRSCPARQTGVRQTSKSHHPADDPGPTRTCCCGNASTNWARSPVQFLEGLLAKQIQGKLQAQQLLALVGHYQRGDVRAGRLERAVRFGAFSLAAIRRILAATAQPKPLLDELADLYRETLGPLLERRPHRSTARPATTSIYSCPRNPADETPSEEKPQDEPDELDQPATVQACVSRSSPTSRPCAFR